MSILILFAIGIFTGVIAAYLGGASRRLLLFHVQVGIVGALLGGILGARLLGDKRYHPDQFDFESGAWACGGAIVLLLVARLIGARLLR